MARSAPTVQQLADLLGLSKFSVSRALSGKSGVSDATRARVRQAAESLKARANAPLRQVLFVTQTGDGISPELWMGMLHGAEREGARHGLTVAPRDARHLVDFGNLDPDVGGLILACTMPDDLADAARLARIPAVTAGYTRALQSIDQVVAADWEGGIVVARHLTALGHRCIGYVRGEAGLFGRRERWRGLREGLADCPGACGHDIGFSGGGFSAAFLELLRSGVTPTALFCAHDGLAVTAMSELARLGIRVPDDVSVVGFFDFAAAIHIVPALTTMRIPREDIGVMLVRLLRQRMGDTLEGRMPPARITLMPELIQRGTVGPPSPAAAAWARRLLGT